MKKQPNKMLYLFLKIFGLAIFLVPIFLKKLNILNELSKPKVITLIILGVVILILAEITERKYKRSQDGSYS